MLEGYYNGSGWHAGDLEQRLNALGVWRDRNPLPADELAGISDGDRDARKVVDAYLKLRDEAGVSRAEAVAEFVRETAYTWANRLLALRCMEARDLIDEVILQKDVYGGRSLEHNRLVQRNPELCAGNDDGLFTVFHKAFGKQSQHLPLLFDPKAPGIALRPSVAALKRAIALLSGIEVVRGQEPATNAVFRAPDAFGWAYQYWNTEEKARVFANVRTEKGAKIERADIIPATQLYTEPYMVKFLVQNSLGAIWAGMNPETELTRNCEYYVSDALPTRVDRKSVGEITFLDPACGSGHFLLEAFDLFYRMYEEEGKIITPEAICRSILERNLFGIDIDARAVQISEAALWMKAAQVTLERSGLPTLDARAPNLVATNVRLPIGVDQLRVFLERHPDDRDLSPAIEIVLNSLRHADELGSLLQVEGPVEAKLKQIQEEEAARQRSGGTQTNLYISTPIQGQLPIGVENYEEWKARTLARLTSHFAAEAEASELTQAFFGRSASTGLRLLELLTRRYDVIAANPPYMGSKNMGGVLHSFLESTRFGCTDLFAAFIARALQLMSESGVMAFVSQSSVLYLTTFASLREEILTNDWLRTGAHLGPGGFEEISGEKVNTVLLIAHRSVPDEESRGVFVRAVEEENKEEALLRRDPESLHSFYQSKFLGIEGCPIMYWAPLDVIELLRDPVKVGSRYPLTVGLQTGDNPRYVRFEWEVPTNHRWVPLTMGGENIAFWRADDTVIDWQLGGFRIRQNKSAVIRNAEHYFRRGVTFSRNTGVDLRTRVMQPGTVFDQSSSAIIAGDDSEVLVSLFNSSVGRYLAQFLSPGLSFLPSDLGKMPWRFQSTDDPQDLNGASKQLIELVRFLTNATAPSAVAREICHREGTEVTITSRIAQLRSEIQDKLCLLSETYGSLNKAWSTLLNLPEGRVARHAMSFSLSAPRAEDVARALISDAVSELCQKSHSGMFEVGFSSGRSIQIPELFGGPQVLNEITDLLGKPLSDWVASSFFSYHVAQCSKRPSIWHLTPTSRLPHYALRYGIFLSYRLISAETLRSAQSQQIRPQRQRYETEIRTIESMPQSARSDRQQERLTELRDLIADLRGFDEALEEVAQFGFGPEKMRSVLRQNAVDDTTLCLKSQWLQKLSASIEAGPLAEWSRKADKTNLHKDLAPWITDSISRLRHHCSAVGPSAPKAETLQDDPNSESLALLICKKPDGMVQSALKLACMDWRKPLDEAVFAPLRAQIKSAKDELKGLKAEDYSKGDHPFERKKEIETRTKELKENVKGWERDLNERTARADKLRDEIMAWKCPDARTWETWLAAQSMYDAISSLDGIRQPPRTVTEWIAQESVYAPDINDGVRVNIAPLQKAGILAADVLAAKDVDKAIADRAEWRADERRWCREGKLRQPGWWPMEKTNGSGQK